MNAKEAETQLSRIFRQAEKWKALLLFDEADVFLRQRSLDHVRDAHIIMFLRTLEYYRGILFLTTNRVRDFDGAMQSRIDLPLKYPDLSKDTRKTIWTDFLKRNDTFTVDERDVESLAEKNFNGRQVYDRNSQGCSSMLIQRRRSKMRSKSRTNGPQRGLFSRRIPTCEVC